MSKRALYKPLKQNTVILEEFEGHYEILLNGEYKTVPKGEIQILSSQVKISSLDKLKESIFINCINNPLSDILYSYNTNRLIPEAHQYKPLIKFLNSENNRILIADEVGLGKTIEAGMIYKEIDKREELKISLIVVPSSLTYKWKEEFYVRFDENFEIYRTNQFLHFIDEVENYSNSKLFNEKIIISYHTLRDERVMKKLEDSFFEVDFLVIDEAHTMRNTGTSTFRSAQLITSLSEHIIFLTATPVQNSLNDLFNILSLLDNDYFKDYEYFKNKIQPNSIIHKIIAYLRNNTSLGVIKTFIGKNDISLYPQILQIIFKDICSLEVLNTSQRVVFIDKLMQSDHLSFIINRTKKKDVGLAIPRSATSIIVAITDTERAYYAAVIEFVKFLNPQIPQGFITIMPERMASSSMIASLQSFKEIKKSGKLFIKDMDDLDDYYEDIDIRQEAFRYLDDIITKGESIGEEDSKFIKFEEILKDLKSQNIKQMVVFSFFKKTLNYLEEKLENLGYSVGKIHGDFSIEDRFKTIKEFKNNSFDILLSSEVGSEGLDMQFCNVVINYDLPWNPMRVEQRIGRIDRIGQKFDKLHIFNLCIVGSIEDRILNRLYSKLDIFENSIGELEPILGNLEEKLNIVELMTLSQAEIDKKLSLEQMALERVKKEISQQTKEFDKMLNNDLDYHNKKENILNPIKIDILQEQTKQILTNYLKSHDINFLELKDGSIKLSSENLKQFFNRLKQNMSNKRTEALKYKEQRNVLQKINKYKELKINFITNNDNEFQTLHMFLNHPLMSIIVKDTTLATLPLCSIVSNKKYINKYAIIYRVDLKQFKQKSYIKTIIIDKNLDYIDEIDYFEFINECAVPDTQKEVDFEEIKNKSIIYIIQNTKKQKVLEEIEQNRLVDIKIDSINNYFTKQIKKTRKLEQKILQEDVRRMRIGEISNLQKQKEDKIKELEDQKVITSSFEILGIIGIV